MKADSQGRTPLSVKVKLSGMLRNLDRIMRSRGICVVFIAAAIILALAKFLHLSADFPNFSPWMEDQAKFTDEGWWASAAVRYAISGNWHVAGDYNPAAALPIWPILLASVFHFTRVSLVAARAVSVAVSLATLLPVYCLARRYTANDSRLPAALAALMFAASPFAFFFARLAILETLVVFEFCLLLLIASFASRERRWPWAALAVLTAIMLLTKTTAALLIPAVVWLAWCAAGRRLAGLLWSAAAMAVAPAVLLKAYEALVTAQGYGEDYHYFFGVNAMPDFDWEQFRSVFHELLLDGFWVDRLLYPLAALILVAALAWQRNLWRNPLFTASWMVVGIEALFIARRADDYAPRYFLVMVVPLIWITVLALDQLIKSARKTALLMLVIVLAGVSANLVMIGQLGKHPDYDLHDTATGIAAVIRSHPEQNQLMLGVSAPQISLMTGIPAINDFYGSQAGAEKLARYQPGWFLAWNNVDPASESLLDGYQLQKAGSYEALDDDDRTTLILYKMVRKTATSP